MIFDINYCEQAITGNYFQPWNTISNLFFIVAAIFLYYFFKNNRIKDVKSKIFLSLIFLIGVGSFLWHFNKNKITFFSDTIPLILFFIIYIYFLILQITKNKKISAHITAVYVVSIIPSSLIFRSLIENGLINGAYEYILTLFFFMIILIYTYTKNKEFFKKLRTVFFLFLLALIFRQVDLLICSYFKIGTHFIWHFLTATTSYYAVKILYERTS